MPSPSDTPSDALAKNPLDCAETRSGEWVHLLEPDPQTIYLRDIAGSLANQCRFNGHCSTFYSVAEHSVHVAELLEFWGEPPRLCLIGLLHDASEAYTGDCISPMKRLIPPFKALEEKILSACYTAAGLGVTPDDWARVATADAQLLADEAFDLMPSRGVTWGLPRTARQGYRNTPWSSAKSACEFIHAYTRFSGLLEDADPTWFELPTFLGKGGM